MAFLCRPITTEMWRGKGHHSPIAGVPIFMGKVDSEVSLRQGLLQPCCDVFIFQTSNNYRMKVFVFYHDETEADIFVEDGGVGCLHHNGEHIIASYYQNRLKPEDLKEGDEFWDILAEGKMYTKDYEGQDFVTDEMIEDTIYWLGFGFSEVEIIKETDPEKYPIK